jgi:uncharacterized protein YndB with AHSA1/START domain
MAFLGCVTVRVVTRLCWGPPKERDFPHRRKQISREAELAADPSSGVHATQRLRFLGAQVRICATRRLPMSTSKLSSAGASTDRIQKSIVLKAPRSKVWRALTDPAQFGEWFGTRLSGKFMPGQRMRGPITTPEYAHLSFEVMVERMEPERLFSWRWQPGGDPDVDPAEPMTLVVFELEDVPEGTRLTVTESGFDQIPAARRSKAYRENDEGWAGQLDNLTGYLARSA